ncbi:RecB family exonuclease [Mucilaginibacter phyllosphaerae]
METGSLRSKVVLASPSGGEKGLIWSYSKMGLLSACPRKFYYNYFGAKKRTALDEPDKDLAQFLKGMHSSSTLIGEIVHFVIRTHLRKLKAGTVWELERLKSFGYHILKNAVKYSVELRDSIFNNYEFEPKILMEVYYGELSPSMIRDRLREQINNLLEMYYNTEAFAHLRTGALLGNSIIEQPFKFFMEGFRVDGIVDLMFDDDGTVIIADWKTGELVVEDTSLQLLSYALWAMDNKSISSDRIRLQKAYLENGALESMEFSAQQIKRARARMIQDVEILKELEEFGNEGVIEAFPCCEQEKVCQLCSFKKICTKN